MIAFSTVFYALECPSTVFLSPTRKISFWQKFVMLRNNTNILVNTIIVLWPWAAISKPLFIISFMSYKCPLPRNSHIENIYSVKYTQLSNFRSDSVQGSASAEALHPDNLLWWRSRTQTDQRMLDIQFLCHLSESTAVVDLLSQFRQMFYECLELTRRTASILDSFTRELFFYLLSENFAVSLQTGRMGLPDPYPDGRGKGTMNHTLRSK